MADLIERHRIDVQRRVEPTSMNQEENSSVPSPRAATSSTNKMDERGEIERRMVDYQFNPTRLFNLLNHQLWSGANTFVETEPVEASIWITSSLSEKKKKDGYWEYLPIHIACMNCTVAELPTEGINDLIVALIRAYPKGVTMPDNHGDLPLHHAIRSGATADVLSALLLEYPPSLGMTDSRGVTALTSIISDPHIAPGSSEGMGGDLLHTLLTLQTTTLRQLDDLRTAHEALKLELGGVVKESKKSMDHSRNLAVENARLDRALRIVKQKLDTAESKPPVIIEKPREKKNADETKKLSVDLKNMTQMNEVLRMSLGEVTKEYNAKMKEAEESHTLALDDASNRYAKMEEESKKKIEELTTEVKETATELNQATLELEISKKRQKVVEEDLKLQKESASALNQELSNLCDESAKLKKELKFDANEKAKLQFEIEKHKSLLAQIESRASAYSTLDSLGITMDGNKYTDEFEKTISNLNAQLKQSQRTVRESTDKLDILREENTRLSGELAESVANAKNADELEKTLSTLTAQLKHCQQKIAELEKKLQALREENSRLNTELARSAADAERFRQLNGELAASAANAEYIARLNEELAASVAKAESLATELDTAKNQIHTRRVQFEPSQVEREAALGKNRATAEAQVQTDHVPKEPNRIQRETPEVQKETPEVQTETPELRTETPELRMEAPEIQMESPEPAVTNRNLPQLQKDEEQQRNDGPDKDQQCHNTRDGDGSEPNNIIVNVNSACDEIEVDNSTPRHIPESTMDPTGSSPPTPKSRKKKDVKTMSPTVKSTKRKSRKGSKKMNMYEVQSTQPQQQRYFDM